MIKQALYLLLTMCSSSGINYPGKEKIAEKHAYCTLTHEGIKAPCSEKTLTNIEFELSKAGSNTAKYIESYGVNNFCRLCRLYEQDPTILNSYYLAIKSIKPKNIKRTASLSALSKL